MLYDCTKAAERERGIEAAVAAVQRGDLVVMPTDTVYGLGADAFKSWAVTALLNAIGEGLAIAWMQDPRYVVGGGTISGRFHVEGSGTDREALTLTRPVRAADSSGGSPASRDSHSAIPECTLKSKRSC